MPGLFMPINETFVVYACGTLVVTRYAKELWFFVLLWLVVYAYRALVVHVCCLVFYGIFLSYFHVSQLILGAKITHYRTVQGSCRIYYNATLYHYTVITVSRAFVFQNDLKWSYHLSWRWRPVWQKQLSWTLQLIVLICVVVT